MPVIFVLFVTDFFDTIGTAVAVSSAGGLLDESGKPPRLKRLLLVDSAAAAGGGAMGVSSVTTYVESGAGVAEGARTGLASVVTAVLLPADDLLRAADRGRRADRDRRRGGSCTRPSRPALIMIGYLMIRLVADVDWTRPEAGIPAFLVIAGVPLTFSISAGIGFGVLGYVAVMIGDRPRPRDPPADVGAGAAVRGVLRLGLAERERLLRRLLCRRLVDQRAMAEFAIGATFADHVIRGVAGRGRHGRRLPRAACPAQARSGAEGDRGRRSPSDEEFRARFRRELEAAASIQHPNVIAIHHAGEEDGQLYVTMRFVDGNDLARIVAAETRLEPVRARRV